MQKISSVQRMERRGYDLLPRIHPTQSGETGFGYGGLIIAIHRQPSGGHFDPQRLHLCLRAADGLARSRTVSWLSPLDKVEHVCPGMLTLTDRSQLRVDFFTSGGSLEPSSGPEETIYTLTSPAPILLLSEEKDTIADQIANEADALLAKIAAHWEPDEKGLSRRMASIDPLLYHSSMVCSVLAQYEQKGSLQATFHDLYLALCDEQQWLVEAHQWPAAPCQLEQLLAPHPPELPTAE